MMNRLIAASCAWCCFCCGTFAAADLAARPNVLFIAVDDLNHWVGHLARNPQTITPHLDRLASWGVSFAHAYCAAPACNPSRTALMSGMRPSTTGVYHNPNDYRPHVTPAQTLNSHFRAHGYHVCGAGKIYHGGGGAGKSGTISALAAKRFRRAFFPKRPSAGCGGPS